MFTALSSPPASRFVVLLLLLLFAVPMQASALSSTAMPVTGIVPSSTLAKQVNDWVSVLSRREPFVQWRNATPDIHALGPGTHSWLVLMSTKGKVMGYMVVQAADDGSFRLGEYGTGPAVLFSDSVLKRTLIENGLITSDMQNSVKTRKHYLHPFSAFWEVIVGSDTYWLDAKTGELLPMDDELLNRYMKKTPLPASAGQGVSSVWLKATFDPYEKLPWLTGEKPFPAQDSKKVQNRIRSKLQLRYVSEPFGDAMLYALPVIGFQRWSEGRLDVALDMEGSRFVPLDTLKWYGHFYP